MSAFLTVLLALVAAAWLVGLIRLVRGMFKVPRIAYAPSLPDEACPSVSLLVAARDEAERLPGALPTWVEQNVPRFEIIVADDRSTDATPALLRTAARDCPRLKPVRVTELPPGWLGKPHAHYRAYRESTGEWLVFTDADVHFAPNLVRRALALARARNWDHLTLMGLLDLRGFWEKTAVTYFGLGFLLRAQPWRVADPRSPHYLGVGGFQLIRRNVYEAVGTHRRLAMEIVDDMMLGKLVKRAGFRSGVGLAEENTRVRWQEGLGNIVGGLTKNIFAGMRYSLRRAALEVVGVLVLSLLPFAALFFTSGWNLALAVIGAGAAVLAHAVAAFGQRLSPLYGLTHPLGALLFAYIFTRSTLVTLWRGGITWRGTFYPLDDLRKGTV